LSSPIYCGLAPCLARHKIKTKQVRGEYKPSKPTFQKLIVLDKENGGKAGALNCGINMSDADLISCIDADCILEGNALVKMVKPFLENTKLRVIAAGGVIRAANNCRVENGKVTDVHLPRPFLGRVQVLEYIRSFLLGRMAWSRLNGLLIISGAFGLFDRKIALEIGGYNSNTVGEDMELVVRMRKYMHEIKEVYRVAYIPDQLCWTQVPESFSILGNQRNRWTRGTAETLWIHKNLLFNPRYKVLGLVLGLLSFPFWLVFEWLAPIVETAGILIFFFLTYYNRVDGFFFYSLLMAVFSISGLYSIFTEEITFHQYRERGAMRKLMVAAFLDPLIFQPFVTFSAMVGNIELLFGKTKGWGEMERESFYEAPPPEGKPVNEKII
jgi:biofilm PGA synthesis N-glycosyltransferase PgaC